MNKKNIYTALLVAVIVGSMLNFINSYDFFWQGKFTAGNITRIALTYITPFVFRCIHQLRQLNKATFKTNFKTQKII